MPETFDPEATLPNPHSFDLNDAADKIDDGYAETQREDRKQRRIDRERNREANWGRG